MFEETAEHSELHGKQGGDSKNGCGSQHRTPVAVDEKAVDEKAAGDELVRARNRAVRAHHKAPQTDVVPPFSGHS